MVGENISISLIDLVVGKLGVDSVLALLRRTRENAQEMQVKYLFLASAALFICSLSYSVAQDRQNVVFALEQEWNVAYKQMDIATMDSLLADDFIITVEDGSTFSKAGYIAHSGDSSVRVDVSDMSEIKVRLHGHTAVVTGAYHEKGTEKGKPYEYRDRFTDVWMNTKGKWRLIASHYARLNH